MLLHLSDLSDEPLHQQISRQVRASILAGELAEGDGLPSIRGLARDCRVSVITVQRAYEDLERESLIVARRGKGFFVGELAAEDRHQLARERFSEALGPVVDEGRAEGLDGAEMSQIFARLVEPLATGSETDLGASIESRGRPSSPDLSPTRSGLSAGPSRGDSES